MLGLDVLHRTVSDADYLEERVCFGDLQLAGDSEQGEEDDHRTASGGKPKGPGNAKVVANESRAKHGGTPEPRLGAVSDALHEEDQAHARR